MILLIVQRISLTTATAILVLAALLLAVGAANAFTKEDELLLAVAMGKLDNVKAIIKEDRKLANAVLNEYTKSRAIHRAAKFGRAEVVEYLISRKVDVNAVNRDGETPLIIAAQSGSHDIIRMLLDAGANVNIKANNGETALMRAAAYGYPEVVRLLLEKGALVDEMSKSEATALNQARRAPRYDINPDNYKVIEKMLLDAGATR